MEQLLLKLARQLEGMDEASLMHLWDKYAQLVNHFEPSQRWEEAALVLSLIQAKRWKNQLFNTMWAARSRLQPTYGLPDGPPLPNFLLETEKEKKKQPARRAKVLSFQPSTPQQE